MMPAVLDTLSGDRSPLFTEVCVMCCRKRRCTTAETSREMQSTSGPMTASAAPKLLSCSCGGKNVELCSVIVKAVIMMKYHHSKDVTRNAIH